jgi:hypothetical protein
MAAILATAYDYLSAPVALSARHFPASVAVQISAK